MNLIIYKHYNNDYTKEKVTENINYNAKNGNQTIAYISGKEDIMIILKELIKTAYQQ